MGSSSSRDQTTRSSSGRAPMEILSKPVLTDIVSHETTASKDAQTEGWDLKPPSEYSDTGRVQISVITISVCNDQDLSGVGNCTQISESLEKVFTASRYLALFLVSAA